MTNDLPKSLTEELQDKWQTFRRAAEDAEIRLPESHAFIKIIKKVFTFSDFVASSCTRDPAMLAELIDSGDLQRRYTSDEYIHKLETLLVDVDDEDTLIRKLRHCRRREMIRIAWRDLAGWGGLSETVADLSAFADACLDQTLNILFRWHCAEYGVPTAVDNSTQRLVIIGLGKLGARELNFSSD
ncbi:MAG: hypothetical protein PVF53_19375, partial [Desulfobacterales bacterium]